MNNTEKYKGFKTEHSFLGITYNYGFLSCVVGFGVPEHPKIVFDSFGIYGIIKKKWTCPKCGQPFYGDNGDKFEHISECRTN